MLPANVLPLIRHLFWSLTSRTDIGYAALPQSPRLGGDGSRLGTTANHSNLDRLILCGN